MKAKQPYTIPFLTALAILIIWGCVYVTIVFGIVLAGGLALKLLGIL